MSAREFSVADAYPYDHRSPWRWVASHIRRYPWLPLVAATFVIRSPYGFCALDQAILW
ncbi:MAG: hypothetical protein M3380_03210 [Chloroflexota bacterium]|nr:hypothetical protein [Chloroflexota bacterium]